MNQTGNSGSLGVLNLTLSDVNNTYLSSGLLKQEDSKFKGTLNKL